MDMQKMIMELMQNPNLQKTIGEKAQADPATVKETARLGVPALLEALTRNAKDPVERQGLERALQDHAEDPVDNLSGFLSGLSSEEGKRMLGHILKGKEDQVERRIGAAAGSNPKEAQNILALLAPMVLGMMAKSNKENPDKSPAHLLEGLTGSLDQGAGGGLMSMAKGLLDKDGDGLDLGDIARGLFGRK